MTAAGESAELAQLSARQAVTALARGEVSAERYAMTLLSRCQAERALNAFITLEPERVLEDARDCDRRRLAGAHLGPLHGLPVAIKDSIDAKGYPATAGSSALCAFRPANDAAAVISLRCAGALILAAASRATSLPAVPPVCLG